MAAPQRSPLPHSFDRVADPLRFAPPAGSAQGALSLQTIPSARHAVQLKNLDQAGLADRLGLVDTGDRMTTKGESPVSGRVYDEAQWETENRPAALAMNTAEAALVGEAVGSWGQANFQSKRSANIYRTDRTLDSDGEPRLDPFIHKIDSRYGDDEHRQILTTYVQHTTDLDGYVIRVEDGPESAPGVGTMRYGSQGRGASTYSSQHESHGGSLLEASRERTAAGFDATTKIVGEGARYRCIANYPGALADQTQFWARRSDGPGYRAITMQHLTIVWKSEFQGGYNIPDEEVAAKLREKSALKKSKGKLALAEPPATALRDDAYMLDFGTVWSSVRKVPTETRELWSEWQGIVEGAVNKAVREGWLKPDDISMKISYAIPAGEEVEKAQSIEVALWYPPEGDYITMIDVTTTTACALEPHETLEELIQQVLADWSSSASVYDEVIIKDGLLKSGT